MRKIKNDPSTYLKRSDLAPKRESGTVPVRAPESRDDWFMTAHIDEGGYIDFRKAEAEKPKLA